MQCNHRCRCGACRSCRSCYRPAAAPVKETELRQQSAVLQRAAPHALPHAHTLRERWTTLMLQLPQRGRRTGRRNSCLFNTCVVLPPAGEKRNSAVNTAAAAAAVSELQTLDCNYSSNSSSSGAGGGGSSNSNSSCTSSSSSSAAGGGGGRGRSSILSLTSNDGEPEGRPTRPNSL